MKDIICNAHYCPSYGCSPIKKYNFREEWYELTEDGCVYHSEVVPYHEEFPERLYELLDYDAEHDPWEYDTVKQREWEEEEKRYYEEHPDERR